MGIPSPFFAGTIGGIEVWLIFAVVLLLFGGAKLPALARGLGQSIKEFKKAQREDEPEPKATETKPAEPKKSEPANTHGSN